MKKDKGQRPSKDDMLKQDLQRVLDQDANLRSYHLEADVVEGQAQLHGVVDVLAEKKRAEDLARSITGIHDVDSAISISTDGPVTDKDVEFEVSEELDAAAGVDPKHIGAKSSRGVVTLVGRTDDPDEIKAARKAAESARGVAVVRSRVRVEGAGGKGVDGGAGEGDTSPGRIFHSQVRNDREKEERGRPKR